MRLVALSCLSLVCGACTIYSSIDVDSLRAPDASGGSAGSGNGASSNSGGTEQNRGGTAGSASSEAGADSVSEAGAGGEPASGSSLSIVVQSTTTSVMREAGVNSPLESDRCPGNQVVMGFRGSIDESEPPPILRSVQAVCGLITVSSREPYYVIVREDATLTERGFPSDVPQEVMCPEHHVVTSFEGHSGTAIDGIELRCARLTVAGTLPDLALVLGSPSSAGILGSRISGGRFDALSCEPGSVAVGQLTRSIAHPRYVETFGFLCSPIKLRIAD